jgi:Tol biopolymer transport system component
MTPSWSADGSTLYFSSNREDTWQIWAFSFTDESLEPITRTGGIAAFEAPDGTSLFFVKPDTAGVWQMPLEGGEETLVLPHLQPSDWGNWTVRPSGIYYIRRLRSVPLIEQLRFSNGRTYRVAFLKDVPEHPSFAVAPDASWFLYTRVERSESDLLLVRDFQQP